MLDIKFVRDNSDTIKKMLADRNMDVDLGGFLELDTQPIAFRADLGRTSPLEEIGPLESCHRRVGIDQRDPFGLRQMGAHDHTGTLWLAPEQRKRVVVATAL